MKLFYKKVIKFLYKNGKIHYIKGEECAKKPLFKGFLALKNFFNKKIKKVCKKC